ncbi:MAG: NADH-quinone oxidoreductase subunit NuoH [Verrucomicrobia bacterium]|jgi:NADH-quinone oxidoreductase subunit H|nr:NADH-quinone oxidoreductase subunit NuoH [Verrucomicrobiota bacterium]
MTELGNILWLAAKGLIMISVVMTCAGYAVLLERKVAGAVQGRTGPNRTQIPLLSGIPVIGTFLTRIGLFQPLADGLKFLFKEDPMPAHVNKFYYVLAPLVAFIPAMTTMTVLPFGIQKAADGSITPMVLADLDVGALFILAVSSLGVYGIILGGWAANSKYPFLGSIRASAQMISYELAMGLSLLPVFMWFGGSLSLFHIAEGQSGLLFGFLPQWTVFYQPLSALIFLVALFAETNRLPFDMPESETDLVAGYNTEYGAFKFGLFFVGEYAHVIIGSAVFVLLFLGGWNLPFFSYPSGLFGSLLSVGVFALKTFVLVFFFMWIRWTLPRFRYDQVMTLGWQKLLPLAVLNLVLYAILIALVEQF